MESPQVTLTPALPSALEKDSFIDSVQKLLAEVDQTITAKQNVKKQEMQRKANAAKVNIKADSSPTFKAFQKYRNHLTMSIDPDRHKKEWMRVYLEHKSKILNNIDTWILDKEKPIKMMVEEGEMKNEKKVVNAELQLTNWYRTADSLPKMMAEGVKKGLREAIYDVFFQLVGQEVKKTSKEKTTEIADLKIEMGKLLKLSNPKIPQQAGPQQKSPLGGISDFVSNLNLGELSKKYLNNDRLANAVQSGNTDVMVEELAGGIQKFTREHDIGIKIEESHIQTVKTGAGKFIGEMNKNNGDLAKSIISSFQSMNFTTTTEDGKQVNLGPEILEGVKGLSGTLEEAVKAAKLASDSTPSNAPTASNAPTVPTTGSVVENH